MVDGQKLDKMHNRGVEFLSVELVIPFGLEGAIFGLMTSYKFFVGLNLRNCSLILTSQARHFKLLNVITVLRNQD